MAVQFAPIGFQKGISELSAKPTQHEWSPYADNGGTTLAIAGKDFCVVAADTRLSTGYSIHSRDQTKVVQLSSKAVLASAGMQADQITLHKVLKSRMVRYRQDHRKEMSTHSIAQMLSNTLYYKRFFPYYTFNVFGGIDDNGEGCVFSYDAVGSYERTKYSASGSGQQLLIPLLDNQVGMKNQQGKEIRDLTLEEVVRLVKDTMSSACERDIYTGDFVDIAVITKDGVKWEKFELKHD